MQYRFTTVFEWDELAGEARVSVSRAETGRKSRRLYSCVMAAGGGDITLREVATLHDALCSFAIHTLDKGQQLALF